MAFNPDDFFSDLTVKNVVEKFPELKLCDYTQESLEKKLVSLNYEIVSKEYEDKKYKDIESYYDLAVDEVV